MSFVRVRYKMMSVKKRIIIIIAITAIKFNTTVKSDKTNDTEESR